MSLANLFVELVVTGFHTSIWIALLAVTLIGYENLDWGKLSNPNITAPLLAIVYILGIIVDKVSDALLSGMDHRMRNKIIQKQKLQELPGFLSMRYQVLVKSNPLYEELGYIRSRMRIARTAIVNFIFTTFAALIFVRFGIHTVIFPSDPWVIYLIILLAGIILSVLSYFAWAALNQTYIVSVLEAYRIVQGKDSPKPKAK